MASTHLYALNGPTGSTWAAAGVKARNCWVWDGSAWQPVIRQWIWDGGTYQLGFDSLPGPLDHITIDPDPASVPAGTTQIFSVFGWDADGVFIDVSSGHSFSWTRSVISDSISSNGDNTATFTGDALGFGGEPYDDNISVTMDGSYSANATATVT